jgi:hypothetical protein
MTEITKQDHPRTRLTQIHLVLQVVIKQGFQSHGLNKLYFQSKQGKERKQSSHIWPLGANNGL